MSLVIDVNTIKNGYRFNHVRITDENALSMHRTIELEYFMEKFDIADSDLHSVLYNLTAWINMAPKLSPWFYQYVEHGAWAWNVKPKLQDVTVVFKNVSDLAQFKLTWL